MRFNTHQHWYLSLEEARTFTSSQVRCEEALRFDMLGFIAMFCVFMGIYFVSPQALFPEWKDVVRLTQAPGIMLSEHLFLYEFIEDFAITLIFVSWLCRILAFYTNHRFHRHHFRTFDELNPTSVRFPIANSYGFFRSVWMNIIYYILECWLIAMTTIAQNPLMMMNLVK